ncbi:MAG: hypothetical protein J7521_20595 [Caulobacter sp.]|nr:hypothetical protein [Caulobacter sp.]
MRVLTVSVLLAALLAGPAVAAARLPTADQVAAYVRENWDDYARRLDGAPASPTLLAVKDVRCRDLSGAPDCAFTVTVRLADGVRRDQVLASSFEWAPDGSLEEVVVLRSPLRST